MGEMEEMEEMERPIFRDIRRYFCEYCGICRSKKTLIAAHVLTHHKEEMEEKEVDGEEEKEGRKSNTCSECGATFRKPAYLKQHMQSHSLEVSKRVALDPVPELQNARGCIVRLEWTSIRWGDLLRSSFKQASITQSFRLERLYTCPVDDCHSSYRRKDHLTRHLAQHQGKLFRCPVESCSREFSLQANMKRHQKQFHCEDHPPPDVQCHKQYVCQEIGCGKVFRFESRLRKHEDSHVKLDSVEAFCSEPGCMKYFANDQCLKAHIKSCHQRITCEICGTKQLKKNIKRHMRAHEAKGSSVRIECNHEDCSNKYSNKSNLCQHVKAVHLGLKPFACSFTGCGMRFAHKHVRDNHEKTGCHVYSPGNFEELDQQFQSRPRGGRKRKYPTVEMLIRKRVVPPNQLDEESDYLAWMLSRRTENEQQGVMSSTSAQCG